MSYARIDDLLPHHDKLLRAGARGPAVFGLYVASICYAQRQRTDGLIPRPALPLLLPGAPKPSQRLLALLVSLRLWDVDGDGWRIHDYLAHNASAAERRTKATTAAHARWNAPSTAPRMHDASSTDASSSPLLSSPKKKQSGLSGLGARTRPDGVSHPLSGSETQDRMAVSGGGGQPVKVGELVKAFPVTEAEYQASLKAGQTP